MNRDSKRWAILATVVVLALAASGVLFAHWTDTLDAYGQIQTGAVGVGWADVSCVEGSLPGVQVLPGPGGGDLTARPAGLPGDPSWTDLGIPFRPGLTQYKKWETNKNVAHVSIDYTPLDPVVILSYFNTYPSYYDDCQMEFTNAGSIPIAVPYLVIEGTAGTNLATDIFAANGEVWVEWRGETPPNPQIDPLAIATGSLKLHVEQVAQQDTDYSFSMTVCVHNWNEPTEAADDVCDLYDVEGSQPISKTTGDPVIVIPNPF